AGGQDLRGAIRPLEQHLRQQHLIVDRGTAKPEERAGGARRAAYGIAHVPYERVAHDLEAIGGYGQRIRARAAQWQRPDLAPEHLSVLDDVARLAARAALAV